MDSMIILSNVLWVISLSIISVFPLINAEFAIVESEKLAIRITYRFEYLSLM